jgi:hypothetical protein
VLACYKLRSAMHANIHVYTYKAGVLARVAHDLRLRVGRHEITVQAGKARGFCEAGSLVIEGVMTGQGLDPEVLSEGDKRQILETVRVEILQSEHYPHVEFEADVSVNAEHAALQVRGNLRLRGQARPLSVELKRTGDRLQGGFELRPSEFGIPPYKALAGAIKLQDRVRVEVDITLEGEDPATLLAQPDVLQL